MKNRHARGGRKTGDATRSRSLGAPLAPAAGGGLRVAVMTLGCALLGLSCVSRVDIVAEREGDCLPDTPLVVAAGGEAVGPLAEAMLGPGYADVAGRTRRARIAMESGAGGASAFWAELSGDFPVEAVAWSLGGNPEWRKAGPWFVHEGSGITIGFTPGGLLLATNSDPARFGTGRKDGTPFPSGALALAETAEFAMISADPFSTLFPGLLEEPEAVPVDALALFAFPEGERGPERKVLVETRFYFRDARSAAVFLPVAKLAWYGIAFALFPSGSPREAFSPPFALAGPEAYASFVAKAADFYAGIASVAPLRTR